MVWNSSAVMMVNTQSQLAISVFRCAELVEISKRLVGDTMQQKRLKLSHFSDKKNPENLKYFFYPFTIMFCWVGLSEKNRWKYLCLFAMRHDVMKFKWHSAAKINSEINSWNIYFDPKWIENQHIISLDQRK